MASLGDPRPLTNEELLDFEQSDTCRKSWYAKSLLLTIGAIREEHFYELELVRAQLNQAKQDLGWFEDTYSTQALAPITARRLRGARCPHCRKNGETGLGDFRICFACGKTWTRTSEPEAEAPILEPNPVHLAALTSVLSTQIAMEATE
jgi:hypothetical protein